MKLFKKRIIFQMIRVAFILFCFLTSLLSVSQVVIQGKIFHKGKKLKGAKISALSTVKLFSPIRSSGSGDFEIETKGKGDQLLISKKGYISKTILINGSKPITVSLEKAPRKKLKLFSGVKRTGCPPSNPYCACCFIKGTKILLNNGLEKNIEQIKPGDLILNTNLENFKVQTDTVYAIDSVIHNNLIELVLQNEVVITSTTDHPYYVQGKGWCSFDAKSTMTNYGIKTQELKWNDYCYVYFNSHLIRTKIHSIRRIKETRMTYNISGLKNNSNYFANGILVSNEKEISQLTEK